MASPSRNNEILEVIQKYNKEEILIDELLKDKEQQETKKEDSTENKCLNITLDDAIKRNQELLKEFELVKARLRSQAIFCPTEVQWDDICHRYQQSPSLPVTTWRCHLPLFV